MSPKMAFWLVTQVLHILIILYDVQLLMDVFSSYQFKLKLSPKMCFYPVTAKIGFSLTHLSACLTQSHSQSFTLLHTHTHTHTHKHTLFFGGSTSSLLVIFCVYHEFVLNLRVKLLRHLRIVVLSFFCD